TSGTPLSAVQMIVDSVDHPAGHPAQPSASPPPVRPRPRYDTDEESRYILIAGGGKVGINLARGLFESGHEVAIIESDSARAAWLANRLECMVYIGDASPHDVLPQARA